MLKASDEGSAGVSLVFACTGIEGVLDGLAEKGVTITEPVWEGHWGAKVAGFEDPEGNTSTLRSPSTATGIRHNRDDPTNQICRGVPMHRDDAVR